MIVTFKTSDAHVKTTAKWDEFELLTPFVGLVQEPGLPDVLITVPAGFVTDWESIPTWVPMYGHMKLRAKRAALLHDFGYDLENQPDFVKYLLSVRPEANREWWDMVFLSAMITEGVDEAMAILMHSAVRGFGAPWYGGPNQVEEERVWVAVSP